MSGLHERKRDVALIAIVNNIINLVEHQPNEKRVVKRGTDQKWIKYRDEKSACNNIVLDWFFHDEEGLRRFMCMNYELTSFVSKTEE